MRPRRRRTSAPVPWTAASRARALSFVHTAATHSTMHELAAAEYGRWNRVALTVVVVLTVIVGSQGISTLATAASSWIDIVTAVSGLGLGVVSGLATHLDWKGRSRAHMRRSRDFGQLALKLTTLLVEPVRVPPDKLFAFVERRVTELGEAEPLPARLRAKATAASAASTAAMWARGGSGSGDAAAVSFDPTATYEGALDTVTL
jgi:hypothetical protein